MWCSSALNRCFYPVAPLDRPAPAHSANRAGSVSRVCRAWPGFPWPDPFPPPPPPRGCPHCSAASPVLRIGPTSHLRSSSACVLRLSDAVRFRGRRWDLPVPVQSVSVMLGVLDLVGFFCSIGIRCNRFRLPLRRRRWHPESGNFVAQYPACTYLYQRPPAPCERLCMT